MMSRLITRYDKLSYVLALMIKCNTMGPERSGLNKVNIFAQVGFIQVPVLSTGEVDCNTTSRNIKCMHLSGINWQSFFFFSYITQNMTCILETCLMYEFQDFRTDSRNERIFRTLPTLLKVQAIYLGIQRVIGMKKRKDFHASQSLSLQSIIVKITAIYGM